MRFTIGRSAIGRVALLVSQASVKARSFTELLGFDTVEPDRHDGANRVRGPPRSGVFVGEENPEKAYMQLHLFWALWLRSSVVSVLNNLTVILRHTTLRQSYF